MNQRPNGSLREESQGVAGTLPGPGGPECEGQAGETLESLVASGEAAERTLIATAEAYDRAGDMTGYLVADVPRNAWSRPGKQLLDKYLEARTDPSFATAAQQLGWSEQKQSAWLDEPGSPANFRRYIEERLELWQRATIMKAAMELQSAISYQIPKVALTGFDGLVATALTETTTGGRMDRHFHAIGQELREIAEGTREPDPGHETPWDTLTAQCRWRKGEVIVIGGRPSTGKSAMVAAALEHQATVYGEVQIESLEMTPEQYAARYAAGHVGGPLQEFRADSDKTRASLGLIETGLASGLPIMQRIFCDHHRETTVHTFCRSVRLHHRKYGITMAAIDYLQRLAPSSGQFDGNQKAQIREDMSCIVDLAKELNIPILVLSQLSRKSDDRTGAPKISDLEGASEIEAAADTILLIDRIIGGQRIVLHLAKQRNGPAGLEFDGTFNGRTMDFDLTGIRTQHEQKQK